MKTFCLLFFIMILSSSCSKYYSIEDYQNVKKIDAHIHYDYANPALLQQAEKDNFRLISVNVETQSSPHIDEQESIAIELMNAHKTHFAFLSTFNSANWLLDDWSETTMDRIDASVQKGASGVKIWKTFGMQLLDEDSSFVFMNHKKLDPVFNHMAEINIPLLAHIGEPRNCWLPLDQMTTENDRSYFSDHPEFHMYLHPDMPSYEQIMNSRDQMLKEHSNLNVVGAHFGSLEWSLDAMEETLDAYPNFAVDMAARIGHMHYLSDLDYEKTRQFFITYHDRILYGTDMGIDSELVKSGDGFHEQWFSDWRYLATDEEFESSLIKKKIKGLKLPKSVIDDIYFNNAMKWYPKINFEF